MEKLKQIVYGVTDFARMRGGAVALCEEISECKAESVKSEELV